MSVFPPERDAISIVDAHAVPARLITLEQLETVAGGNRQIIDPRRGINTDTESQGDSCSVA
jgi:hypothetical protein